ncbi:MAG: hypothetical protein H5T32_03040 [Candidatus Methanosuratus sp.]|nr:hypothetical protein [Candidatus Methanosuratincola sp.]
MAFWSSLLKWLIIGTLLVVFPWTIPIAALYLIVKSGIFRKILSRLHELWRKGRIFDRISDWKARSCKSLKKESVALDYYLPSSESPYVILVRGAGFVCVSSFSIKDRSRSPETYKMAVSEVLKALGGGDRTISFVGIVTDEGDFLNSMQIASKHGPSIKAEFERAGIEQMELLNIARTVIASTSPTAGVEIHRGKDIILRPMVIP